MIIGTKGSGRLENGDGAGEQFRMMAGGVSSHGREETSVRI